MNRKFFDLKKEKQDRIMNAAFKAFAENGYKHAGTEAITKDAGISKGLLFFYFENKIGVYTFLYSYSVKFMVMELNANVNKNETELFGIVKSVENARVNALRDYPYMQQFLNKSMTEDVTEALASVCDQKKILLDTYEEIFSHIDYSLLPAGIDGEKLKTMTDYTIAGMTDAHMHRESFNPEVLMGEINEYLDMMKKIVYR